MLKDIFQTIRTSKWANQLLFLLGGEDKGIGKALFRFLYLYENLLSRSAYSESRMFFRENIEKIRSNIRVLTDEKSKYVYKNMIRFRATKNYKYHPGKELPQYFIGDIFTLKDDEEVFLDIGGCDGNTSVDFINFSNGKYRRIVIFEPDKKNVKKILHNKMLRDKKIEIVPKGVWSDSGSVFFTAEGTASSRVVENGGADLDVVPVIAIDDVPICENATFIKMDIEGSEMRALYGAKKTILKNKPKMAICIYHSDSDMLDVIRWVHSLVPEYKVYVRHHSAGVIETVAYFTI